MNMLRAICMYKNKAYKIMKWEEMGKKMGNKSNDCKFLVVLVENVEIVWMESNIIETWYIYTTTVGAVWIVSGFHCSNASLYSVVGKIIEIWIDCNQAIGYRSGNWTKSLLRNGSHDLGRMAVQMD